MTDGLHTACCKLLLSIVPDPPLQASDERGWLTMCTSSTLVTTAVPTHKLLLLLRRMGHHSPQLVLTYVHPKLYTARFIYNSIVMNIAYLIPLLAACNDEDSLVQYRLQREQYYRQVSLKT